MGNNLSIYRNLIRPALFLLPAESAYDLATVALRLSPLWRVIGAMNSFESSNIRTTVGGINIKNPVGLAAGLDKDCKVLPALSSLGFGYVTCGTVTLHPRPGNPKKRLIRDRSREALINSMGFPNKGLDSAVERIKRARRRCLDTPIVVSVSGTEIDDIVTCHRRLEPLVDAVEINISSPNTEGLRIFQEPDVLETLLNTINAGRSKPLFVKMPPFPRKTRMLRTTIPVENPQLEVGSGGLSGKPIYEQMLRMVSEMRERIGDKADINACGGVFTAKDARRVIEAGATTIQMLTGFVYNGPCVAPHINKALSNSLAETHGVGSIHELVAIKTRA
ncbi:Dihydroorotate dehydrogenase (quinone) [Geodia barretti]|uniref:Dihydroorotate oxidase n=1 Tax=Geodia barretti TaxID=519541 RepID=A0AA35W971_GEOBA|nr:Dihydroorotate dehydrogenase (quinone) [Geodia barretti]